MRNIKNLETKMKKVLLILMAVVSVASAHAAQTCIRSADGIIICSNSNGGWH